MLNQVSSDAKTLNRHYARRKDLTARESYHGSNGFNFYTNNKVKSGIFLFHAAKEYIVGHIFDEVA